MKIIWFSMYQYTVEFLNFGEVTDNFIGKKVEKIKISKIKTYFSFFKYNIPALLNFQVRSPNGAGTGAKSLLNPLGFAQSLIFSRRSSSAQLTENPRLQD